MFAATILGILFYEGKIVKQDVSNAIMLLNRAAESNVLWAQNLMMYINGVPHNDYELTRNALAMTDAVEQLEQHAYSNEFAAAAVSEIYLRGTSFVNDLNKATHFLNISSQKGCLYAKELLHTR